MTKAPSRPETFNQLQEAIIAHFSELSRRLQQIASHALDNPNEMALETIAVVAQRAGVQPSSLIRFAKVLGFSGYSEMQRVFRARLTDAMPDYQERLRSLKNERSSRRGGDTASLLEQFVEADTTGLQSLLQQPQIGELLEQCFALIAGSETVYLVAHRRSFPVTCYLSYALSQMKVRNVLVDSVGGMFFQQASHATVRDTMLAVSTRTYSPEVVQVVTEASQRGVRVIAITDSPLSPLSEHAAIAFKIPQGSVQMFRSLAVPMTFAVTFIVGLGRFLETRKSGPRQRASTRRSP
jgi:DNA-binding MurR/RpiR family transcriptional regulator